MLDGESAVILTGPLTTQLNVSISEKPTPEGTNQFRDEKQYRRVGYVVAKGDGTYEPTKKDANAIHYISLDETQKRSEPSDHTGLGAWDYVLDPKANTIVLGQRTKVVYHANVNGADDAAQAYFAAGQATKDQIYTFYSSADPYSNPTQLTVLDTNPTRPGYALEGWYCKAVTDKEVKDNPGANLFDFNEAAS